MRGLSKANVVLVTGIVLCIVSFSQVSIIHLENIHYKDATTFIGEDLGEEILLDNPIKIDIGTRYGYYIDHETNRIFILTGIRYKPGYTSLYYLYEIYYSKYGAEIIREINVSNIVHGLETKGGLYYYNNCLNIVQGPGKPLLAFSLDNGTFKNSTIIYPEDLHPDLPPETEYYWMLLGIWQNKLIFLETNDKIYEIIRYIGEYSIDTLERLNRIKIDFWIDDAFLIENNIFWFELNVEGEIFYRSVLAGYSLEDCKIIKIVREILLAWNDVGRIYDPIWGKGFRMTYGISIKENLAVIMYSYTPSSGPSTKKYFYSFRFYNITEYDNTRFFKDLTIPIVTLIVGGGLIILVIINKLVRKMKHQKILFKDRIPAE